MAELFQVSVSGADELRRAFNELPKAIGERAMREAATKALQPVLDEAKTALIREGRVKSGDLLNSMEISARLKPTQSEQTSKGTVSVYAGGAGRKGAHAHLVEFGHKLADGTRVPPHPFLRPAWDANKDKVLGIMRTEIWKALAAAARRLVKQAQTGRLSKSNTTFFAD